MPEVRFYHLQRITLEQALPRLLEKILDRGWRAVVLANSDERIDRLTQTLWTYDSASFLPHGDRRDGMAERQWVWLTAVEENPNGAQVLVLTDGASAQRLESFSLVCDVFDGNDSTALSAARERWRRCKSAGCSLTYWQQTENGGWVQKA
ncbi:DNA polymerase III subunit chi [Azospirillaceae bacterium]